MSKVKSTTAESVTLANLLTVLFVALKLTGHIDWAWGWVISPILVVVGLTIGLFSILGVLKLVEDKFK